MLSKNGSISTKAASRPLSLDVSWLPMLARITKSMISSAWSMDATHSALLLRIASSGSFGSPRSETTGLATRMSIGERRE